MAFGGVDPLLNGDAHLQRGALNDLHRSIHIICVEVDHLRLSDFADLGLADGSNNGVGRVTRALSKPAALRISFDAGGVFNLKSNERSS